MEARSGPRSTGASVRAVRATSSVAWAIAARIGLPLMSRWICSTFLLNSSRPSMRVSILVT